MEHRQIMFDAQMTTTEAVGKVEISPLGNLLQVKHITLIREGRTILNDLNLTIRQGEVHALLGLNGSGKSSLAQVIMGCNDYAPDSGQIIFDGRDITDIPIDERAKKGITLAWQEPARFEGLTVQDYLMLGMPKPSMPRMEEALEAVTLMPKRYQRRPVDRTLSGGERKRIELAAVYAMRPRLAILDEPDSGIDVLSLDDVSRLIRRMAEEGITVLLITHRAEMVAATDRASLICSGHVKRTDTPEKVQEYYSLLCQPHGAMLGPQPWDTDGET